MYALKDVMERMHTHPEHEARQTRDETSEPAVGWAHACQEKPRPLARRPLGLRCCIRRPEPPQAMATP